MRLLLVESDGPLAASIASAFRQHSWEVTVARDSRAARSSFEAGPYDVAIIDWALPPVGSTELELCAHLRQRSRVVGIIFIGTTRAVKDRLLAFDAGADDYLMKPFDQEELVARGTALARRSALWPLPTSAITTEGGTHYLECGSLKVDMATLHVTVQGEHVELTLRQLLLVVYLLRNQGRLVPEAELREHVLRTTTVVQSSTIRNHIHQLREKLGAAKVLIQSVHGKGYCISAPEQTSVSEADEEQSLPIALKSSAGQ